MLPLHKPILLSEVAMESSPKRPVKYRNGIKAFLRGDYAQAAVLLAPLIGNDDPIARTSRTYLGLTYRNMGLEALSRGDFKSAQKHLVSAIQQGCAQKELNEQLASACWGSGRLDECADRMEQVVDSGDSNCTQWRKLAQAQWASDRRHAAYMTIEKALRLFPNDAMLHLQAGLFKSAEEKFDEARQAFAQAAQADCCCVGAHMHLGLTAIVMQDLPAAVEAFQKAIELSPHDLICAYYLTLTLKSAQESGMNITVRLPDPAAARIASVRSLWQYVATEPDFIDAMLSLADGSHESDTNLRKLLLTTVKRSLVEYPDYADLNLHAAKICAQLDQPQQAIGYATKAVELDKSYASAHVFLGRLQAAAGRREEAVESLKRAVSSGGDWPDVHCLAGELLIEANRIPEAREHLCRALELNANYKRADAAMRQLAA